MQSQIFWSMSCVFYNAMHHYCFTNFALMDKLECEQWFCNVCKLEGRFLEQLPHTTLHSYQQMWLDQWIKQNLRGEKIHNTLDRTNARSNLLRSFINMTLPRIMKLRLAQLGDRCIGILQANGGKEVQNDVLSQKRFHLQPW